MRRINIRSLVTLICSNVERKRQIVTRRALDALRLNQPQVLPTYRRVHDYNHAAALLYAVLITQLVSEYGTDYADVGTYGFDLYFFWTCSYNGIVMTL